jgi:glycine hydroxymethyltransferase
MSVLARRTWIPESSESFVQSVAADIAAQDAAASAREIEALVGQSRAVHERECINLNPAGNVMNPRAEALLARGLGSRPSLGYPRAKQETGLEAIERIEAIAAALAAEIFGARFVEFRVGSGALANLYAFMAMTKPGDAIIAPSAPMGGHVSHHGAGAAGLHGLTSHPAPTDPRSLVVDLARLRALALEHRPRLITLGASFNLFAQPIREVRRIADEIGAWVLYDAAHMSGPIAGRAWQQPLEEGAHVMTMSTYKSLGGPAGGLILTNEPTLAERLETIAFPGLTANFDVARAAALAMTLLDWKVHGRAYAQAMLAAAAALAGSLDRAGVPIFASDRGCTSSHLFVMVAAGYGGGQTAARRLRRANILAHGGALPLPPVEGDLNGIRLGTPEIVRWGMMVEDMTPLAGLVARALRGDEEAQAVAPEATAFRKRFDTVHYVIER